MHRFYLIKKDLKTIKNRNKEIVPDTQQISKNILRNVAVQF